MNAPAYDEGFAIGKIWRRDDPTYDVRYDLAAAARAGTDYFAEFKRGLTDGMNSEEE